LGLLHHEMWRDELHNWLLACESASLGDLFHNMGTEGHPALGYIVLWLLSKVSHDAALMQGFNACCGIAAVWIVARHAPLGWVAKVLLATGYLFLFEYTCISRVYALELLLLVWSLHLITSPNSRRNNILLAISLVLLSLTVIHGTLIAGSLSIYAAFRQRRWLPAAAGVGGSLLSAAHVWAQTLRIGYVDDRYYAGAVHDATWAKRVFTSFLDGVMPLPDFGSPHFWNTHVLRPEQPGAASTIGLALTLALISFFALLFWRDKLLLLVWVISIGGMFFISAIFFEGFTRHHSHFFLASLAGLWIIARSKGLPRWQEAAFATLLGVSWVGGAYAYAQDWHRPFSNASAMAGELNSSSLAQADWCGSMDFCATPVAYFGKKKIFSAQSAKYTSWIWWANEAWDRKVTQPEAMARFDSLCTAKGEAIAIILSLPTNFKIDKDNYMHLYPGADGNSLRRLFWVKEWKDAIVEDENYIVYAMGDYNTPSAAPVLWEIADRLQPADLPDTSGKVQQHFDQMTLNDTTLVISGWAFLTEAPNEGVRPKIALKGKHNGYQLDALRHFRKDVQDAFPDNCDTDSAGFYATFPRSWIEPDTYQVGAYLVNPKLQRALMYKDTLVVPSR
jgi:hypothetical protein